MAIFKHDCEDCKFLGTHEGEDLYVCPAEATFVVRFGDRPADNKARETRFVLAGENGPFGRARELAHPSAP